MVKLMSPIERRLEKLQKAKGPSLGSAALDTGMNTAGMAATGAAIGSVVPGVGTAAGALAGASLGALKGIFSNASASKQAKEINKAQEEAEKAPKQVDVDPSAITRRFQQMQSQPNPEMDLNNAILAASRQPPEIKGEVLPLLLQEKFKRINTGGIA